MSDTLVASASWRHDGFVAAATFAAGLLGYGFNLVLSHSLGPSRFGELSALLAVAILATVPGTAMQAGIARRLAAAPEQREDAVLLGEAAAIAVAVGVGVLALGPLLRSALGVESWASIAWLAAVMVPTTLSFGCLGVLQGRRRFVALGWLLVLVQASKLLAAVFAAATGTGVQGALGATAVITSVVVAAAVLRISPIAVHPRAELLRGVLAHDAVALLGVLLLSNLDLILAKHYLPEHDAGLYAAGNLITKAAFWGPSFVSTVAYPRLARPAERRAALVRGSSVLAVFAVVTTVGAALAAPLVPVVIGHAYRQIAGMAWLFALQGAALAGVLFSVYAGLAVNARGPAAAVWVVALAETGAVALHWHHSVGQVLGVVLCGSAVVLVTAVAQQAASLRRGRAERTASPR